MRSSRTRLWGWATLAAALAATCAHILYRGLGQQFAIFDFAAYYYAAVRLGLGHGLYPQLTRDFTVGELGLYLYPPPVAAAFLPFTVIPVEAASVIWAALLLGLAAVVIFALTRPVDAPLRPLAAGLLVLSIPLQTEVANGNLTLVTLALVLAAWRLQARSAVSGALLAIALVIKLMPALLVPFLLAAGRWRVAAATAIALGLVVGLSWPWLGASWLDYLRLVQVLAAAPHVSSATHDMVPAALASGAGRYVLPALALGIALYAGRLAVMRPASARLAFAVTLAAAPLISSFVFYPYLVLSLPLVVLLCFIERRPAVRVVGLVGLLLTDLSSPPAPWDTVPLVGLLILLVDGVVVLHSAGSPVAGSVPSGVTPSEGRAAAL
jgi:glycosyl transferase family 87